MAPGHAPGRPLGPDGATCVRCWSGRTARRRAACSWAACPVWHALSGIAAETAQSLVVIGPTQSGKTTSLAVPAILGWRGPGRGGQRQERPAARHAGVVHAAAGTCGASTPRGVRGAPASTWSPLAGCRDWRAACRVGGRPVRGRQGARAPRPTASSGTPPRPSCWPPSLLPPRSTGRHHGRRGALGRHPGGGGGGWHPRAGGAARGAARGAGDLVPRRAHTQLRLHDRRDRARAVRPRAAGPPAGRHLRAGTAPRSGHTLLPVCAGARPAPAARVLHRAHPARARPGLHLGDTGRAARSTRRSWSCSTRRHTSRLCPNSTAWPRPARHTGSSSSPCGRTLRRSAGRYGARAPTVLNNHRAKLFLPGIADPDTLEYASRLIGDEEVSQPSVTRDPTGRRSTTSTTGPRRLLPPEELRCLPRGQAVLVYGTLPPARLQLRPWLRAGRVTVWRRLLAAVLTGLQAET